jgi:chorismate mutase
MFCRGVRGATTVEADSREEILKATRELLALMIRLNDIQPEQVGSAIFSTTPDLNAEFPALAARQLGWLEVPMLCTHELAARSQHEITHVYIKEAARLRPDLCSLPPVDFAELEAWIQEQMKAIARK